MDIYIRLSKKKNGMSVTKQTHRSKRTERPRPDGYMSFFCDGLQSAVYSYDYPNMHRADDKVLMYLRGREEGATDFPARALDPALRVLAIMDIDVINTGRSYIK